MYGLDNNSGINVMPAVAPTVSPTPLWFTDGGANQPPSYPGQDWFNIITAELLNVLAEAAIAPNKADSTQLSTAIKKIIANSANVVPVGVPLPWPTATAPQGWLKCNGAAFSKTQYPQLALAYPSGVLPDLRGEFMRGWDDGRGVDSGRGLLTAQTATWIQPNVENNTVSTGIVLGNGESEFNSGVLGGVANMSGNASNGPRNRWYIRPRNIAFNFIVRAA
jgi:phage-related tail fiber protein